MAHSKSITTVVVEVRPFKLKVLVEHVNQKANKVFTVKQTGESALHFAGFLIAVHQNASS